MFVNGPGDRGSILDLVIPKTQKIVLDTSFLNAQHHKVQIKVKVEQSKEMISILPYISVSYLLKREPSVGPWLWLLIYKYIYIYICRYSYMCMYTYTYMCKPIYVYIYMCIHMSVYMWVYVCIYACMYIHIYIYIHVYI